MVAANNNQIMYIISGFWHQEDIFDPHKIYETTVMILSFRTDRSEQTVQTQIRLLLEEQSDQGLHCLPFRLHRLDSFTLW